MADQRADLSTRIAAHDEWDAGFHTDSEVGAIDVGLSVQPRAVGVVVDAPGVGTLRVAFDVGADGTTRLARATRKLGDGREAPFVAVDEAQVLRLEGDLRRAHEEHTALATQVAEREARLSALEAELFAQKSEAEVVATHRDTAAAALLMAQTELNAHVEAAAQVTAERDELRARLANSAPLDVLSQRNGRIAALEGELSAASAGGTVLEAAREAAAERDARIAELEGERLALNTRLAHATEQNERHTLDATTAQGRVTALEAERDELNAKLAASSDSAARITALEAERDELSAKLAANAEHQTRLPALEAERDARIATLEAERDELNARLAATADLKARITALEADRDALHAKLSASPEQQARIVALETERDELNAKLAATSEPLAALEAQRDELSAKVAAVSGQQERITTLEAEREELSVKLEGSARQQAALEARRDELSVKLAASSDQITALEAERNELSTKLAISTDAEARISALETERDELRARLATTSDREHQLAERTAALEATVDAKYKDHAAVIAKLEKRLKELQQADAATKRQLAEMVPLSELEAARAELETLRNNSELTAARERVALLESDLGRREESLSMAVARSDAFQGQLASLAAQVQEAREVAVKLKAQSEKMLAERDEARGVARSLHQKLNASAKGTRELSDLNVALGQERQIAATLLKEKEELGLKIEALGRMIEQERNGRTQALSERDEWQSRFKALAKGATDVSLPLDFSREQTRSYTLEQPAAELPTHPEIPAVKKTPSAPGDATDPLITKPKGK